MSWVQSIFHMDERRQTWGFLEMGVIGESAELSSPEDENVSFEGLFVNSAEMSRTSFGHGCSLLESCTRLGFPGVLSH